MLPKHMCHATTHQLRANVYVCNQLYTMHKSKILALLFPSRKHDFEDLDEPIIEKDTFKTNKDSDINIMSFPSPLRKLELSKLILSKMGTLYSN